MARPATRSAEEILDGAEALFREQGFGQSSLRQVMAAGGVSPTAFYARFPSKEAVLEALVERLLTRIYRREAEVLAGAKSLQDGFDRGVSALVEVLLAHPELVRLTLTEACSIASLRALIGSSYATFAQLLIAQIDDVAARSQSFTPDSAALAWSIVGAMQLQIMRWAVFESISDSELKVVLQTTAHALLPAMPKQTTRRR